MTEEAADSILGPRFDEAFAYASALHRRQFRKGKHVPYLGHLMGVAALVLEDGGGEDETIAALLHDAVEEGGIPVLNEIRRRFGAGVAEIVEGCTDHDPARDRPSWHVRKRRYVATLATADERVLRVCLADKLDNARDLLADYRQTGERVWCRFSAGREYLSYLRALADMFSTYSKSPMADELQRAVSELEHMATTAIVA